MEEKRIGEDRMKEDRIELQRRGKVGKERAGRQEYRTEDKNTKGEASSSVGNSINTSASINMSPLLFSSPGYFCISE